MYEAITRDIRVRVEPHYDDHRSEPERSRYFWLYTVDIVNEGETPVTLETRSWRIIDANGAQEHVDGPGVVGKTPTLEPGETFTYTSGCPLTTSSGIMAGSYQMVEEGGDAFDVTIPTFSLDVPFVQPILN
ncbi:MAG: Co2+/Mg2+ efflux protein ApaG [Pseudomonadota bacterium]